MRISDGMTTAEGTPRAARRHRAWERLAGWSRWPAWLFAALVALYLVPYWRVRYVPTTDGPSHLYNAWVLEQLASDAPAPVLRQYYVINRQPSPNWLSHVVLAALLRVLAPPAAEKALLSGYLVLLAASLWYLAGSIDRERAWLALLGLPFLWNLLLQFGFYNFCISIGFFLLAIAFWWRHRLRPDLRFAVALNVLLLLCYFSHLVSAVLALLGIAVLWLASLRRERWRGHLAHLAILAPAIALPLWFILTRSGGDPPIPSLGGWRLLGRQFANLDVLWIFWPERGWTGKIVAALFAVCIAFTLLRELIVRPPAGERTGDGRGDGGSGGERARPRLREEDGFLALALLLTALYFFSPSAAAHGSLLKPRLMLYPFLAVIPWLSPPRLGRWGRTAAIIGLALLAARPALYALACFPVASRQVEAFVRGLDAVPAGSVVVPLIFIRDGAGCLRTTPVSHALGYAAIGRELIDWDNYEAVTDYFPLRFRPEVGQGDQSVIESDPLHVPLRRLETRVDYVFCWRMPPDSGIAERLASRNRLVAAGRGWRLYATDGPPG